MKVHGYAIAVALTRSTILLRTDCAKSFVRELSFLQTMNFTVA
jgi:hypothetical protein